jgi:isopentenyl phosphate kinase
MDRPGSITFLKLGGSLITDKSRVYTVHRRVIARLADEVRQALDAIPELPLLIGHGSGSFGHWAAKPYGTRQGVKTPDQWRGYAKVAIAAARLNRIVLDTRPIHAALAQGLVPLVYGDVALDDVRGGTIISTEDIFLFLAKELCPRRILLLGEVSGVLDPDGNVISHITPSSFPTLRDALAGSAGVDVTGGMADKVTRMVRLVQHHPEIEVHILTGNEPHLLTRVLLDANLPIGTRITAQRKILSQETRD